MKRHLPTALALVAIGGFLTGCVPNTPADADATVVTVASTADDCVLSTATVTSGAVTFRVTNSGDRITEFYLFREDGRSIVAELEDIAPGSSRDLSVVVEPGNYVTECKPGMVGAGVGTAEFTVTDAVDAG